MTREEIKTRFDEILIEQLGDLSPIIEGDFIQEGLGATSLDMASIQMAVEDEFGLAFATSAKDFTDLDRAWEAMKTVGDGVALIERFAK